MKKFEKWWENATVEEDTTHKHTVEIAWKAALEWVAKQGMLHYGNDFLTDMNELSTDIQIELGMLDEHGHVLRDKDKELNGGSS